MLTAKWRSRGWGAISLKTVGNSRDLTAGGEVVGDCFQNRNSGKQQRPHCRRRRWGAIAFKTVENSRDLTAGGEGGGRLMMRGENLGYRRAPKTLLDTEFKTTSIAPFPTRKHKWLIFSDVCKDINQCPDAIIQKIIEEYKEQGGFKKGCLRNSRIDRMSVR